jgi:methylmalonyl-CoA mutase cobalamin-binding subunit
MADRDFSQGDIDEREQAFIIRVVSDVLEDLEGEPEIDLASLSTAGEASLPPKGPLDPVVEPLEPLKVLALPANDSADVFVLRLLAHLLESSTVPIEIVDQVNTPLKVVERIAAETPDLVLISHLPPDGLTAARYLVRRIKARNPQLTIAVARWDESKDAESAAEQLSAAGASVILGSLAEARDYLIKQAKDRGRSAEKSEEIGQFQPAVV